MESKSSNLDMESKSSNLEKTDEYITTGLGRTNNERQIITFDYKKVHTSFSRSLVSNQTESTTFDQRMVKTEQMPNDEMNFKNISSDNIIDAKTLGIMVDSFLQVGKKGGEETEHVTTPIDCLPESSTQSQNISVKTEPADIKIETLPLEDHSLIENQTNILPGISLETDRNEIVPDSLGKQHLELCEDQKLNFEDGVPSLTNQGKRKMSIDSENGQICGISGVQDFRNNRGDLSESISFDHKKVQTSYSRGKKSKTETEKNVFSCSSCSQKFDRVLLLKQHEEEHIFRRENPFTCRKCNRSFSDENDFQRHQAMAHKLLINSTAGLGGTDIGKYSSMLTPSFTYGKPSFECQICEKSFSGKSFMTKCLASHKCHFCDLYFKRDFDLQRHLATHQTENKSL